MNKLMKKGALVMAIITMLCGCTDNVGTASPESSTSTSSSTDSASEISTSESTSSESISGSSSSESSTPESNINSGVLADLTGTLSDVSSVFECSDGWTNGSMFNCT